MQGQDPCDEQPAAGGQRNVLVKDQLGADFSGDPERGFGGHIKQLPKNIVVTVGPCQQTQQETPEDEPVSYTHS
ncbi:hypothetical protein, partial [Limnohabitans sp.]|uniref:hypothetical protein n=1 Tax=Limnohabitans sp. TaxID=1907725 RepID=UPI0031FD1448